MQITSKGQVTIPQEVREQAGLPPYTDVEFVVEKDGVRIVKAATPRRPTRGRYRSRSPAACRRQLRLNDRRDHGADARRGVSPVLVDSMCCSMSSATTRYGRMVERRTEVLKYAASESVLVIKLLTSAEVSVRVATIELLDKAFAGGALPA